MASVHISLNVSDLDRSAVFYERMFGSAAKRKADYAKFVALDPEIHLALEPAASPAAGGVLSHLGIRVGSADEVRRRREELTARGLAPEEEKREACCYALQEKFWVTDPDGNRWEIYTVLEDLEASMAASTACCPRPE